MKNLPAPRPKLNPIGTFVPGVRDDFGSTLKCNFSPEAEGRDIRGGLVM